MPEFFPAMNVREMNLYGWNGDTSYGVTQSNAGVGVSCGIKHYRVEFAFGVLNPSDQLAFEVSLAEIDIYIQFLGTRPDLCLDVSQGHRSVNFWFALTEQVEVGTIEEQGSHADGGG